MTDTQEVLMDPHSEAELAAVHPLLRTKVRAAAAALAEAGIVVHVIQGYRTKAEQDALFAKRPAVTKAPGGYSNHNFGIAVDLAPGLPGKAAWTPDWTAGDSEYLAMVKAGQAQGLVSGSTWHSIVDWPHFQLAGIPVTPSDAMRAELAAGGLAGVWAKFVPGDTA